MKKFVCFLTFVLMAGGSVLDSYAEECAMQTHQGTLGIDSDDHLYLTENDKKGPEYQYLKCDSDLGDKTHCRDNTTVFVTKKTFVGDGFAGFTNSSKIKTFTTEPQLIKCKVDINDKWEKVGGIDTLPTCDKGAPKDTITVNGRQIHCKLKRTQRDHEYCIGINKNDICVERVPLDPTNTPGTETAKRYTPKPQQEVKVPLAPTNVSETANSEEQAQSASCDENDRWDPKQGTCVEAYSSVEQSPEENAEDQISEQAEETAAADKKAEETSAEAKPESAKTQEQNKEAEPKKQAEEKKEAKPAKKATEEKKAAAPAKKAAQQKKPVAAKKTFKDKFKEECNNFPKEMEKEIEGVKFTSTLSKDGTHCTLKTDGSIDQVELISAMIDANEWEEGVSCSNPEYTTKNTYSMTCKDKSFSGKMSVYFAQITCQDNHTFDYDNGTCNENQTCENNSYDKSGDRSRCRAAVGVDISTLLNSGTPNQKNLSILSVNDKAEVQSKFEKYKQQYSSDGTARTYVKYDMVMKCCGKESLNDEEYAKYQSSQNPEQMVAEKNSVEETSEAETKNDEEAFRAAANHIVNAYNKQIDKLVAQND